MAKNRIIFYSIFGVYQVAGFIFTLGIDPNNTGALFHLLGYLSWFKYITFFGVMLIIVDFIWSWRQSSKIKKETEEYILENNTLKAKIYDIQESKKQVTQAPAK